MYENEMWLSRCFQNVFISLTLDLCFVQNVYIVGTKMLLYGSSWASVGEVEAPPRSTKLPKLSGKFTSATPHLESCADEKLCGIRSPYLTYSSTPRSLPPAVSCTIAVFHLATPSLSWPTAAVVPVWVSLTVGGAVQTHHKHLWLIFRGSEEGGVVELKVQVCSCVNDWLRSLCCPHTVLHTCECVSFSVLACE